MVKEQNNNNKTVTVKPGIACFLAWTVNSFGFLGEKFRPQKG